MPSTHSVLIVEDDPAIRGVLAAALTDEGYHTLTALHTYETAAAQFAALTTLLDYLHTDPQYDAEQVRVEQLQSTLQRERLDTGTGAVGRTHCEIKDAGRQRAREPMDTQRDIRYSPPPQSPSVPSHV